MAAAATITLVVVFAAAEIGLRLSPLEARAFALNELTVPSLIGDSYPNQSGTVEIGGDDGEPPHYYDFTTNAQGFRGPVVDWDKPDGSFRILAIGDSYTWGDGVEDDDVWLRALEADLSPCGPVEVINVGIVGRNTVGEADYLRDKGVRLKPDLILVGAEPGDAMDILKLDRDWDNRAAVQAGSKPTWLLRMTAWSRVGRLYFGSKIARLSRAIDRPTDADGAWARVRESLVRMKTLAGDADAELVVFGIAPTPDDAWTMQRLSEEVQAAGVGEAWFEAGPRVDERGSHPGWWQIPGDGHYTAEGNAVLADVVREQLRGGLPAPFNGPCSAD